VESTKYRQAHVSADDDKRIRGDVDCDGRDEAAVYLYCHTGSGVAAGRIAVAYAVFSQMNDTLTLIGVVTAQKQEPDMMPTTFASITLEQERSPQPSSGIGPTIRPAARAEPPRLSGPSARTES
jgi:hypothetical protein